MRGRKDLSNHYFLYSFFIDGDLEELCVRELFLVQARSFRPTVLVYEGVPSAWAMICARSCYLVPRVNLQSLKISQEKLGSSACVIFCQVSLLLPRISYPASWVHTQ